MPAPTNHPLFKWQYTVLDDNAFSDGRTPDALTLIAQGSPIPDVVTKSARPTPAGPWWLPQDLAYADDLVTTVLHVAKILGTLPVLESRRLIDLDRVDVLSTWDLRVPIPVDREGAAANPRIREIRRLLRRLATHNDEPSALDTAEAAASAIADLYHESPTLPTRDGRLAILRFRHDTPGGDASEWRICPALLVETAYSPHSQNGDENAPSSDPGRVPIRLSEPEGIRRLGLLYAARGDMDQAVRFLVQAAERGDAESMVSLGHINRRVPDAEHLDAAYDCFRSAANIGHGPGAFCAGLLQAERGVFEGDEGAEAWWEIASDRGVREAPTVLGDHRRQRDDVDGAERWWLRGAELGDSYAAMSLGLLRSQGSGAWFEDDGPDSAEHWWQQAFELGHPRAAGELARRRMHLAMYDGPDGVEAWLLRGVTAGDAESMFLMGALRQVQGTLDGEDGAWFWTIRAAQAGSKRAMDAVQNPKIAIQGSDGTIIG